ncbi:MAG: HK97 family phage prohead protease [Patescibacteria group bacterium]|nr:HK97 family phage prohead protease [Patescibacteria group bacterium]
MAQTYRALLKSIRSRESDRGIITADRWLRSVEQCVDGKCPSGLLEGVTAAQWRGWLKAAGQKLTCANGAIEAGSHWQKALDGNSLPPHTIATFPAIVTTTRQDRDGDVLESKGALADPLAPLLWQHIPDMPIGRALSFDAPTQNMLQGRFSIASTALGQDAALLAEHGALRISHGFLPTKWEPLDQRDPFAGYHILEFKILEVSLVSVPSNPDAVIEAFSRDKLAHPLVKAWASAKFKERPSIAPVGIDLRALPPGTTIITPDDKPSHADKTACTCHQHKGFLERAVMPAIPFKDAPISKSDSWDADAAIKGVREWTGVNEDSPGDSAWSKYADAFALLDGPKDDLTSYKLPYKQIEDGKLVINPRGVSAGIGALNGGRGAGMDISENDRKGAYETLAKAYKKAYPDQEPPELKAVVDLSTKGVYVDLPGSFERTSDQLRAKLKPYLLYKGKAGEADWCCLAATYADHGVASVLEDALMPGAGCCAFDDANANYYRVPWAIVAGEPNWTGEPVEVPVTELLSGAAKAAYAAFTKGFLRKGQMADLKGASDRLQKAYDHEDAKAGPKLHIKRAKAHVDAVVAEHEEDGGDSEKSAAKGFVSDAHRERLEKAANHAQKALDHAETTEPMAKHVKAAKAKIEGVRDAHAPEEAFHDEGDDDDKRLRLLKEGRAVSAANEKKLRSAQSHLKEIAGDDDAHPDVAQSASDGAESIEEIFVIGQGGDSGNDYDADGNYTGTDMGAYTDGEPNKSHKAALSKTRMALARKAAGHAQAIIAHTEAAEHHKGHAMVANAHLKSVMGESASGAAGGVSDSDGPALGTDPSTAEPGQASPQKSPGDRASALADEFRFAVAEGDERALFDVIESAGAIASLVDSVRAAKLEIDLTLAESQLDRDLDAAESVLA